MTEAHWPDFFRRPRGPFSQAVIDAACRHAAETPGEEACGLVLAGEFMPCRNVAANPAEAFEIDAEALSWAFTGGELEGVIHSHPGGPWWPSAADMASQIETGVPWAIVIPGEPESGSGALACAWGDGLPAPALFDSAGRHQPRAFCHGVADCYSIARAYYSEQGAPLPEFPRDWEWWTRGAKGPELYLQGFEAAGFELVTVDQAEARRLAQPGDAFLKALKSETPNHCAMYLGDGLALDHLPLRLSSTRPVNVVLSGMTHHLRRVR
jgi:proteasome lid subunit RPN8/RPN11